MKMTKIGLSLCLFLALGTEHVWATPIHPPEHYEKYWALLVGSDDWAGEPAGVQANLNGWYNWKTLGNIQYIKNPSGAELLDTLAAYQSKVGPNDFFMFWYSGHGTFDKIVAGRQDEKVEAGKALDKFDEALYSSQVKIYDDQLAQSDFLGGIKGDKLAVFADCFAGGMWGGNDDGDFEKVAQFAMFASSTELQTTASSSSFVSALIDGLANGSGSDSNKDGHLTIAEWYKWGDAGNKGELISQYKPDGTFDERKPVIPQYFGQDGMGTKFVAYQQVPEPSSLALLLISAIALLMIQRRHS